MEVLLSLEDLNQHFNQCCQRSIIQVTKKIFIDDSLDIFILKTMKKNTPNSLENH